jgi:taurine dioxygenase
MPLITITELSDDLPFGARVYGVTLQALADEAVRQQLREAFDARGVLVFKDTDRSSELHIALSEVFGRIQAHALKQDGEPEVVDLEQVQEQDLIDIDGKQLAAFLPWHFDACYTAKLNRAAILRPVKLPDDGGMTGFADGIQLYHDIAPDLRAAFEDRKIIYYSYLMFQNQRFGVPANQTWVSLSTSAKEMIAQCEGTRRSVHPAIWQRESGERVLHVSPWQAAGIAGEQTPQGDELLERLCDEIYAKMKPYWHRWEHGDMVLWDNLRFIHAVSGNDPRYQRHLQRATIEGDYGLGAFADSVGAEPPMMG